MARTVDEYLATLPDDRRAALQAVRDTINANLPEGYVEGMIYNDGFIGWYVPLERYPDTYNKQPIGPAALASQKQYMALYLTSVYSDPELDAWFRKAYAAAGKKLDMGKSCVRFKTLDALPLDVIGQTIAKVPVDALIAQHEAVRAKTSKPATYNAVRAANTPKKPAKQAARAAKKAPSAKTAAAAKKKKAPEKKKAPRKKAPEKKAPRKKAPPRKR